MSIIVKHGDPGVLVGLAHVAGDLQGSGMVRQKRSDAELADLMRRRALGDQQRAAEQQATDEFNRTIALRNDAEARAARLATSRPVRSFDQPQEQDTQQDGVTPAGPGRVRVRSGSVTTYRPLDTTDPYAGAAAPAPSARDELAMRRYLDQRNAADELAGYLGNTPAARAAAAQVRAGRPIDPGLREDAYGPGYRDTLAADRAATAADQGQQRIDETQRANQAREKLAADRNILSKTFMDDRAAGRKTLLETMHEEADLRSESERDAFTLATSMSPDLLAPILNPLWSDAPTGPNGEPLYKGKDQLLYSRAEKNKAGEVLSAANTMMEKRNKEGYRVVPIGQAYDRYAELTARFKEHADDFGGLKQAVQETADRFAAEFFPLEQAIASNDKETRDQAMETLVRRLRMTPRAVAESARWLRDRGYLDKLRAEYGQAQAAPAPAAATPGPVRQEIGQYTRNGVTYVYVKGSPEDPEYADRDRRD